MEGKPLGKERREEIETHSKTCAFNHQEMLTELLAAELYWRESAKNAGFYSWCSFCRAGLETGGGHKPDCPWVLAQ